MIRQSRISESALAHSMYERARQHSLCRVGTPRTNTILRITFLLTQLQEALYEDLYVQCIKVEVKHHFSGHSFIAVVNLWGQLKTVVSCNLFKTRKMVPITGGASSFLEFFLVCTLIERKRRRECRTTTTELSIYPKLYISSQTTCPPPNHNLHHTQSIIMSTLYLNTYIHIHYELFYSQRLLLK